MEKSGSFGAELASWAQREVDASQADFEALSKVESLSELQELNERILKRYVESGMSEGEKIQKMMFAAFTDGFAAMSKAAGVPLK
jgi:Fe-S cluster assembly ATPase SufC